MRTTVLIASIATLMGFQLVAADYKGPRELSHCLRDTDPGLGEKQKAIVHDVRKYIESKDGKPLDAYYKVTRVKTGYAVHVLFVYGYDSRQFPITKVGGGCNVDVNEEGKILELHSGL